MLNSTHQEDLIVMAATCMHMCLFWFAITRMQVTVETECQWQVLRKLGFGANVGKDRDGWEMSLLQSLGLAAIRIAKIPNGSSAITARSEYQSRCAFTYTVCSIYWLNLVGSSTALYSNGKQVSITLLLFQVGSAGRMSRNCHWNTDQIKAQVIRKTKGNLCHKGDPQKGLSSAILSKF